MPADHTRYCFLKGVVEEGCSGCQLRNKCIFTDYGRWGQTVTVGLTLPSHANDSFLHRGRIHTHSANLPQMTMTMTAYQKSVTSSRDSIFRYGRKQ
jgi:hypothetical protein